MKTKYHRKIRILLGAITLLALVAGGLFFYKTRLSTEQQTLTKPEVVLKDPSATIPQDSAKETNLPASLLIKVPFTPQAPTANWDELHNEACEEASSIMAYAYFNQINSLPAVTVENEITKLTDWQNKEYGYYLSITTNETARMITSVYKMRTEITQISEQVIKKALSENKLVIFPGNGQLLKNPNFKQPGPIYHMLVITGYNEQGFITNDPGTRKGQDYQYSYDTLYQASGAWDHAKHEVDLSKKQIIIVSKK